MSRGKPSRRAPSQVARASRRGRVRATKPGRLAKLGTGRRPEREPGNRPGDRGAESRATSEGVDPEEGPTRATPNGQGRIQAVAESRRIPGLRPRQCGTRRNAAERSLSAKAQRRPEERGERQGSGGELGDSSRTDRTIRDKVYGRSNPAPAGPGRDIKVKPGEQTTAQPSPNLPALDGNRRFSCKNQRNRGTMAQDQVHGNFEGVRFVTASRMAWPI